MPPKGRDFSGTCQILPLGLKPFQLMPEEFAACLPVKQISAINWDTGVRLVLPQPSAGAGHALPWTRSVSLSGNCISPVKLSCQPLRFFWICHVWKEAHFRGDSLCVMADVSDLTWYFVQGCNPKNVLEIPLRVVRVYSPRIPPTYCNTGEVIWEHCARHFVSRSAVIFDFKWKDECLCEEGYCKG